MKCRSCDCLLSDHEVTRKSLVTGDYFDMCTRCLAGIAEDIEGSIPEDDEIWDDVQWTTEELDFNDEDK